MKHNNPRYDCTDSIQDHDHSTAKKVETILNEARGTAIATLKKYHNALTALSLELFRKPILQKDRVTEILKENGLVAQGNEGYYKAKLLKYEEGESK